MKDIAKEGREKKDVELYFKGKQKAYTAKNLLSLETTRFS